MVTDIAGPDGGPASGFQERLLLCCFYRADAGVESDLMAIAYVIAPAPASASATLVVRASTILPASNIDRISKAGWVQYKQKQPAQTSNDSPNAQEKLTLCSTHTHAC